MIIVTTYHGKDFYDFENNEARVFDISCFRDIESAEKCFERTVRSHTEYLKGGNIPWFAVTYLEMDMATGEHAIKTHMDKGVQKHRLEFNKEAKQTGVSITTAAAPMLWGFADQEPEHEQEEDEELE
jgi:hypothetical protein